MHTALRVTGRIVLVLAALLAVPGVLSLSTGGLMFALPFVFLIPGAVLAAIGGVLLWLGRRRPCGDVAPPTGP